MSVLRLIQGGVTATSYRALILTRQAPQAPRVLLSDAANAPVPGLSMTRVPGAGRLRQALDARAVGAYLVEATRLAPGATYRLQAASGDQAKQATVKTLPQTLPEGGMSVAVGSCYYDGYKRGSSIGKSLQEAHRDHLSPLFHIWAGDNIYMDVRPDGSENRPVDHTLDRYLRYLLDSEYAEARALAPTFTVYDDHEYWNNYPNSVPWLSRSWDDQWEGYRAASIECVNLFQSSLNPPGGTGYFQVDIAPLSFLFLDTRTYRSRAAATQLMAAGGSAAVSRWVDQLSGPGVLVLGQPLWIGAGNWTDLNLPAFKREYAALWSDLRRALYDVLVISGDVHHSRVLSIAFNGTTNRKVFEYVVSPTCHIPTEIASIGLGNSQGHGNVGDVPDGVPNSGQPLSARYFFGTDSPHALGLLRFTRVGADSVRVGASFVEHYPRDRYAAARAIRTVPRVGREYAECHEPNLCVLRQR